MQRPESWVCVPGTLCDQRVFVPVVAALGIVAECTAICDASVEAAAERVLATAPPTFAAMGFSLGGFVVLEILRRAPQRLSAVVLISSHAHPEPDGQSAVRRAQVDLARQAGLTALIDELWPRYVAPAAVGRADLKATIEAMAISVGTANFHKQVELAINRPDSRADIARSGVPILVLCGVEDAHCPRERYVAAASGPLARLVVLPGVGHFVPLEAPREAAGAISDWLQAVGPC